jgi:hypothetical protein
MMGKVVVMRYLVAKLNLVFSKLQRTGSVNVGVCGLLDLSITGGGDSSGRNPNREY